MSVGYRMAVPWTSLLRGVITSEAKHIFFFLLLVTFFDMEKAVVAVSDEWVDT